MRRLFLSVLFAAAATASGARAQSPQDEAAVTRSISDFTDAVNRGDVAAAVAHFTARPSITEDGEPYLWNGPGAVTAWIAAMGANAQAHALSGVDMRLLPATRVEMSGERAYAIVPGVLTYSMKSGQSQRADGQLTFALRRVAGDWKIETMTWTGPRAK